MGIKWDKDATPSGKLLSLYTLLLIKGKEMSLGELARELKCSKQSVSRMLDQLEASQYGKLLRDKRGKEAIYHLDRPKKLPMLSLNAEGLHQLALCRDFMIHLLPESIRNSVDATLRQASAYLPEQEGEDFFTTQGHSYVKGHIDYTPFQKLLQTLTQAIKTNKICSVRYQPHLREDARTYLYAPKRLLAYHETLRFVGWIVTPEGKALYDEPTVFLLHRMKEVSLTRTNAINLPDPEDKSKSAFGLISGELFTVAVRFEPFSALYVSERKWSADQKIEQNEDGSITLTMTARSDIEVISWVLGFGDKAEILSPDWLREEVAEKVRAMAERYNSGKSEE